MERSGPVILVVDDYEDGREMLAELLRVRGVRALTAATGEEGLAATVKHRPDLVLSDLSLPDIDGLEVARRIKARPDTASIHVVILTAHVSPDVAREAERAGCSGFVTKPCMPSDLVRRLEQILGRSVTQEAVAEPCP